MLDTSAPTDLAALADRAISKPLVTHLYTADPSAHVFDGKIYIYVSHDVDSGRSLNDDGSHFQMVDYHVLCMDSPEAEARDCGAVLHLSQVPWAQRQMWAPAAACKDGKYYLYFPAKRANGLFQIGVAIGDSPTGPFQAEAEPMVDSYSIDPAVFADDDGEFYLYYGGIWGGQLQHYRDNRYDPAHQEPADDAPALGPRMARLGADMKQFAEAPREILIVDEHGEPLRAGDHARRYFEGPWIHKHHGRYYLSYSTGNTHLLCYAVSDTPYGPFVYQGVMMQPVVGWTTHHAVCRFGEHWQLFYHDALQSGGVTHLRSVKRTALHIDDQGGIETIAPYGA